MLIFIQYSCLQLLIDYHQIDFERRFQNAPPDATVFVSIDCVDFRIQEPTEFDVKWWSHKFNGPGLRYEIGLNINNGYIVWAYGGYPCGRYPDLRLARQHYINFVDDEEKTIADNGYRDRNYFICPMAYPLSIFRIKQYLARHETVNKRIRHFMVLSNRFRHELQKHRPCFYAVVNLTQIAIQNGEPLYQV